MRMSTTTEFMARAIPWARSIALAIGFVFAMGICCAAGLRAQTSGQQTFSSPDEALQALVSAAAAKNRTALGKIFGSDYDKLLSGDQVEDDKDLADFSEAVQENATLQKDSGTRYIVIVGKDNWPTPIPIIQKEGKWMFDTQAGMDEVLNRRVARTSLQPLKPAGRTRWRSGSTTRKAIGITMASLSTRSIW
jgi:Protein of unknown function (DUF2950)